MSNKSGHETAIESNVEATMRDGTILRADVYHPSDQNRYPPSSAVLPTEK